MADHAAHDSVPVRGVPLAGDEFFEPPEPPLEFSDMPHEGSPPTPNKVKPDVTFVREFFNDSLEMPDRTRIDFWSFKEKDGPKAFPAPAMRLRQGQVAHTILKASKRVHTIHHHGIEPWDTRPSRSPASTRISGAPPRQARTSVTAT
jgi:hypothetical protein